MAERDEKRIKSARALLLDGPALVERCLECLHQHPAAVITDIDGTISNIAATPDAAIVEPEARAALQELAAKIDLVGVITGRSAQDGKRMVGLPELLYVGNHGLEQIRGGESTIHEGARSASDAITGALDETRRDMEQDGLAGGLGFENKQLSASIHYRLAGDPDETARRLRAHARRAATSRGLRVTEGRFVVELRPRISINKGTAAADLVMQHGLRGMIFLGDDVTDVDAFRVVRGLSKDGSIAGCAVAVASPEVQASVLHEADGVVDGVPNAIQLLTTLATEV